MDVIIRLADQTVSAISKRTGLSLVKLLDDLTMSEEEQTVVEYHFTDDNYTIVVTNNLFASTKVDEASLGDPIGTKQEEDES